MFNNQTAIVTGGACGIGLAYCKTLLDNGLKSLYILDASENLGENVTKELNIKYGGNRVSFYKLDVTDMEEYRRVIALIIKKSPKINIFINNAGVNNEKLAIQVNLIGVYNGMNLALEIMGKDKGGEGGIIVNTASILGLTYSSYIPAYTASKWGVVGFTKAYGNQRIYSITGVKVMAICPGFTITKLAEDVLTNRGPVEEIEAQGFIVKDQRTENVAKALLASLKADLNGSIWVSENEEEPYQIKFPKYTDMKVK